MFALADRIPELYVAALGTLKRGAVFCPLFSAFGPEPIRQRLELGAGEVLVTTGRLYRRKVEAVRADLPKLEHVLLVEEPGREPPPGCHDLGALMAAASGELEIPATDPEQMALLHFTSGTTGTPKGAVHVHGAVLAHFVTGELVLDFHPEDVFWCTADPGWVSTSERPWAADGLLGVRLVVTATLAADHRASDGYRGGRFLAAIRAPHPAQLHSSGTP